MDKIQNPLTGRLVIANGTVAKKLYNMHIKGQLSLPRKDYIILKKYFAKIKAKEADIKEDPKPKRSIVNESLLINLSSFENIKVVSTQGTSRIYNAMYKGQKYYVKEVIKNPSGKQARKNEYDNYDIELAVNEVLASRLYVNVYKVDAVELYLVHNDSDDKRYHKYMVASKAIEIDTCEPISDDCRNLIENKIPGAIEPFLVDCILANWDVGSRGNVGIVYNNSKKEAFRIDVGGALLFRALGAKRNFTNVPNEHLQFFQFHNKGYKLFNNITKEQIDKCYKVIERVNLEKIDKQGKLLQNVVETLPDKKDIDKATKVLSVLDTVKDRHEYYINNKPAIVKFLESKLHA
jgi:hypothetical protein